MNQNLVSGLTDQEILLKAKNLKTGKIVDAFIVGLTVGIFIFSAVKYGFGIFTLFPLIIGYLIVRNANNNKILDKEIQKELISRNLK